MNEGKDGKRVLKLGAFSVEKWYLDGKYNRLDGTAGE